MVLNSGEGEALAHMKIKVDLCYYFSCQRLSCLHPHEGFRRELEYI